MLAHPSVQYCECRLATIAEHRPELLKIMREMAERIDWIIGEARILGLCGHTGCLHRAHVVGMREAASSHMVLDEPQRPSEVQLEPTIATPEVATGVLSTTTRS